MTNSTDTFSSATVDQTAASTAAPALRRYAHPPLVNPIEPGVAAHPARPGTGVDTMPLRPDFFEERRDPAIYDIDEQDVLITAAGGHPAKGHSSGWILYGRHIVMVGIERTAAPTIGAPKITYYMGPLGRRHVEGCVFDGSLGGADDQHYSIQGPHLWNPTTLADFSRFHVGSLIITPSLRLYRLTTPGVFVTKPAPVEPTHEGTTEVFNGTAGLTFKKKYSDLNGVLALDQFKADFPRQTHTYQNIYSRGRHGSYFPFDGGPTELPNNVRGDGQDYVRASTPITEISRDGLGVVTLKAPGHGLVAGTHTRINVCFAPYETLTDGSVVRRLGGVWVPTVVDASTITYQTGITSRFPPLNAQGQIEPLKPPTDEPFVLQSFTKAASCSLVISQTGVATITTEAPHNSPGLNTNPDLGLKTVRLFGRSLPKTLVGTDLPVTATGASTFTVDVSDFTNRGASGLQVGNSYPDLVVTMHGKFTDRYSLSSHADFDQCDNNSRNGTVRYYRCTDTHHSYDHTIGGLRFKVETGSSGLEYDSINIRRRQEIIPYDNRNFTLYCNESDQSAGGPMGRDDFAAQCPRRLTEVNFGNEVRIELDLDEDGTSVVHPPAGSRCNGDETGSIDQTVAGQRFLTWPAEGKMFGRCNLDPCQGGDTTERDIVQRSQVGSGYVMDRLTTASAPLAPTVEPSPTSFSENTPKDAQLGWIRCPHGQEDQIVDVTLDEDHGGSLGGRFRIRGARLLRGLKALNYAGAEDIGGGQRGYKVPLIATMRSDITKKTAAIVTIPVTREMNPFPVSSATWSPTALPAGLELSDVNLTVWVEANQSAIVRTIKATRAITDQKAYFEVKALGVTAPADGRSAIGLAPATLGSGTTLYQSGAGGVSLLNSGALLINGAAPPANQASPNLPFLVAGSVIRVCVDRVAGKFYLALNGGAWANGADPVAGTGGYSLPSGSTSLFPAVTTRGVGDRFTLLVDGGSINYPIPAGYAVLSETWNPAALAAGLVLSNANLTVSVASGQGATNRTIKATKAITGRKVYFEVTTLGVTPPAANGRAAIGLAPAALGSGTHLFQSGSGAVGLLNNGRLYINGTEIPNVSGLAFLATGSVVRVCTDLVAGKLYLAVNGGAWANGADPVAGTGGYDLPSGSTSLFPAVTTKGVGDSFAAAFDRGALSYPIPGGYAAL